MNSHLLTCLALCFVSVGTSGEEAPAASVNLATRFIAVKHGDLQAITKLVTRTCSIPSAEIPLQVVANVRTREVFLCGPVDQMKLAEMVIRAVDTDPPPPGLGE